MIHEQVSLVKKKIMLAEDDASLGFVIKDHLQQYGYEVTLCVDGEQGAQTFRKQKFDLCILDVMLPKKDGFSLATTIRGINRNIPILFITAKSMIEDKLKGFESGADDYITKPFDIEELVCRMEVFLKRNAINDSREDVQIFSIGLFEFHYKNLCLKKGQLIKTLTQKEADILRLLYLKKGLVIKREEILMQIWGDDDYFMGRSMDVFISRLRKYLKEDPTIQIVNYHGVGFKLESTS